VHLIDEVSHPPQIPAQNLLARGNAVEGPERRPKPCAHDAHVALGQGEDVLDQRGQRGKLLLTDSGLGDWRLRTAEIFGDIADRPLEQLGKFRDAVAASAIGRIAENARLFDGGDSCRSHGEIIVARRPVVQ